MSESDIQFLKNLKTTLWSVAGVIVTAVIFSSVAFYFNARNDIKINTADIEELKKEKANKETVEVMLQNISFQLNELNKKIDIDVRY